LTVTPLAEQSGATTVSVTVMDGAGVSATTAFGVTVRPVNDAPTLNALADLSLNQGSGPRIVNLAGIGSGASNENQVLLVTATSSNPSVIPAPLVSYVS